MRVLPDRSIMDMMFVVRRLQEIDRKVTVSFFVCFLDLQKANNTIDRTLLWKVFSCIGVARQMVAMIGQSHDGIRARV